MKKKTSDYDFSRHFERNSKYDQIGQKTSWMETLKGFAYFILLKSIFIACFVISINYFGYNLLGVVIGWGLVFISGGVLSLIFERETWNK